MRKILTAIVALALVFSFTINQTVYAYDLTNSAISDMVSPLINEEYRNVMVNQVNYSDIYNFQNVMLKQLEEGASSYYMCFMEGSNIRRVYFFKGNITAEQAPANFIKVSGDIVYYEMSQSGIISNRTTYTSTSLGTDVSLYGITSNATLFSAQKTGQYIEDSTKGKVAYYEAYVTNGSVYLDSTTSQLNFAQGYKGYRLNKWTYGTLKTWTGMYGSQSPSLLANICGSNYTIYNENGQYYYKKDLTANYLKQINIYPKDSSLTSVYKALDFYANEDTTISIAYGNNVYIQNYYSEKRVLVDQRKQYWNAGQTYKIYKGNSIGFYNINNTVTNYIGINYDTSKVTVKQINPANISALYTLTPPTNPDTGEYLPDTTGTPNNGSGTGTIQTGGNGLGTVDTNVTNQVQPAPVRTDYPEGYLGDIQYGFASLVYYISLPFKWIGQALNIAINWMSGAKEWIVNVSNFFAVMFSFLPTPVVNGIIMVATVSIIFTIMKVIRG